MGTRGLTGHHEEVLRGLLRDAELYHDDTQLRYFILGQSSQGTVFGMWKQCQREAEARKTNINRMDRDTACRRAELAYARARARRWAFTARAKCEREKARQEVLQLEESEGISARQREHALRELRTILDIGAVCARELGAITQDKREVWEREYWTSRLKKQVRLCILAQGNLDAGILETVASLPTAMLDEVMQAVPKEPRDAVREQVDLIRVGSPVVVNHKVSELLTAQELTCLSSS